MLELSTTSDSQLGYSTLIGLPQFKHFSSLYYENYLDQESRDFVFIVWLDLWQINVHIRVVLSIWNSQKKAHFLQNSIKILHFIDVFLTVSTFWNGFSNLYFGKKRDFVFYSLVRSVTNQRSYLGSFEYLKFLKKLVFYKIKSKSCVSKTSFW